MYKIKRKDIIFLTCFLLHSLNAFCQTNSFDNLLFGNFKYGIASCNYINSVFINPAGFSRLYNPKYEFLTNQNFIKFLGPIMYNFYFNLGIFGFSNIQYSNSKKNYSGTMFYSVGYTFPLGINFAFAERKTEIIKIYQITFVKEYKNIISLGLNLKHYNSYKDIFLNPYKEIGFVYLPTKKIEIGILYKDKTKNIFSKKIGFGINYFIYKNMKYINDFEYDLSIKNIRISHGINYFPLLFEKLLGENIVNKYWACFLFSPIDIYVSYNYLKEKNKIKFYETTIQKIISAHDLYRKNIYFQFNLILQKNETIIGISIEYNYY